MKYKLKFTVVSLNVFVTNKTIVTFPNFEYKLIDVKKLKKTVINVYREN